MQLVALLCHCRLDELGCSIMRNPVRHAVDSLRGQNYDRLAEHALSALPGPFLPWSGTFAMRPYGVLTLLNDAYINQRRLIAECGGGVSTVYLGRLLKQIGDGQVHTIEHDLTWVRLLQAQVDRESLPVEVHHAPLTRDGWYETKTIPRLAHIDLLVVDGPPAYMPGKGMARYPALPYFADQLADGATVLLDDIVRPGEQGVADRWEKEHAIKFERRFTQGAVAVGTFTR